MLNLIRMGEGLLRFHCSGGGSESSNVDNLRASEEHGEETCSTGTGSITSQHGKEGEK